MKKFTLGLGCLLASGFLCSPAMAQEWGNYNSEPFTMPADVEAVECQLNFYDPDFNEIQRLVNVAITDEFIYIQGFSEYLPEAVVRLEYNTKLGVAFLMQDEYVGDYEGCPYYTRLYEMDWEEMQMVPISLNAEGLPFEVDPEECTLRTKGGSYYYWYLTF